jgi:hypothetical protein
VQRELAYQAAKIGDFNLGAAVMRTKKDLFIGSAEGEILAYEPNGNKYIPVVDATGEFNRLLERYPVSREKQAFYQQKVMLTEEANVPAEQKRGLLRELSQDIKEEVPNTQSRLVRLRDVSSRLIVKEDEYEGPPPMPIPGGVGCGVMFKPDELLFNDSSTLYCFIVANSNVGSPQNRWLYLTSTNRAPKCLEAFVSYKDQEGPSFTIYDWSRATGDRWIYSTPISLLGQYQFDYLIQGALFPVIYIMNVTVRLSGNYWKNAAFLYNFAAKEWSLVYYNDYELPPEDSRYYLWWGPIIETFYPHQTEINNLGFFEAALLQDGEVRYLTPQCTYFERKAGFDATILGENHSFIVR